MKMIQLSLALACLLAGADAFGVTPPEVTKPTCDGIGHTGNLAVLATLGESCDNIARGHDYTSEFSCENADGSDTLVTIVPGVDVDLKALCPEKCGVPCGHAPKVDNDAIGAMWPNQNGNYNPTCAALRDGGLCKTDMLVNWFCGQSCRGGAPWDECMWHKSARQAIDDDCAVPSNLAVRGYQDAAACEADAVANYLGDSTGTCPGDVSGATCYYDKNLSACGSTQVAQCPGELDPFRRRKLTHMRCDAMKTKGVFEDQDRRKLTLTASGSK